MPDDADRVIDIYQRRAREWDQDRGRNLSEKSWLDRFIALVPAPGAVLDIGCGSGEPIARYLIANGLEISGVDAAPAMIDMCQVRFPGNWIVADMRRLSMGRRFGGLLAWDSFFHLSPDDQRAMFPIFQAHAQPQGALMFTSGPSAGHVIGDFQGEPLYHASLDAAQYRELLEAHGFAVMAHVPEDASCGGRTVWLARRSDHIAAFVPPGVRTSGGERLRGCGSVPDLQRRASFTIYRQSMRGWRAACPASPSTMSDAAAGRA